MKKEEELVEGQEDQKVSSDESSHDLQAVSRNGGDNIDIQSEADLPEKEEGQEDQEDTQEDYSRLSKAELVQIARDLTKEDRYSRSERILREIKPLFEDICEKEKSAALDRFIQAGGVKEDFDYKSDPLDQEFEVCVKLIRDRKHDAFKEQEARRNQNFVTKTELLEQLRSLVDGEDSENSFNTFKQIQQSWKKIGAVPSNQARTLWANYNALVDRFYDQRSIYFELKELDRKRNLESKLELCERAEKLLQVASVQDAVRELNELHHEFKHIGPVPLEDKEALWSRFKTASDAVYHKRDAFVAELQKELGVNLVAKEKLIEEVTAFADFSTDRIKEWNAKTKEILELQKKWEAIGGVPRAKAKDINRRFWSAFKNFFSNKSSFFKKLDGEREQNLEMKSALIQEAKELKDSTDWSTTSEKLKDLQRKWKEIGPVPEKLREKVFQEFKNACDHFFAHRREQFDKLDHEQDDNLKRKEEICENLERLAQDKSGTMDQLHELTEAFNNVGFVPRKAMNGIKARYDAAVDKYMASMEGLSEEEKGRALLELELVSLRSDPQGDRKLFNKEQTIRKRISKVENDIAILRNNLEFFGRSKNAEKLKGEFNEKLEAANDHLTDLKQQLKLLRAVS